MDENINMWSCVSLFTHTNTHLLGPFAHSHSHVYGITPHTTTTTHTHTPALSCLHLCSSQPGREKKKKKKKTI